MTAGWATVGAIFVIGIPALYWLRIIAERLSDMHGDIQGLRSHWESTEGR